jgi:hypothetical protein
MAVLITTGSRIGMRTLGGGGRTTTSSYEQMTRYLRQVLGADHAALFAQPSERPGQIDWYTGFDSAEKPVRLAQASPEQRGAAVQVLKRLVADITAKADELAASDGQPDRILGEMLRFALEVPDEDQVWLIGAQPVLTFWGHVRDIARPENVLRGLIQKAMVRDAHEAPEPPAAGKKSDIAVVAAPKVSAVGRPGGGLWLVACGSSSRCFCWRSASCC